MRQIAGAFQQRTLAFLYMHLQIAIGFGWRSTVSVNRQLTIRHYRY
jgi:hypothetical protein